MNKPKILFFIAGSVPTEAERNEASEIVGNVVFRNASIKCEFPESCDGVAGVVPDLYKKVAVVEPEAEKTGKKAPRAPKTEKQSEVPSIPQTPLIPAEDGWKANS